MKIKENHTLLNKGSGRELAWILTENDLCFYSSASFSNLKWVDKVTSGVVYILLMDTTQEAGRFWCKWASGLVPVPTGAQDTYMINNRTCGSMYSTDEHWSFDQYLKCIIKTSDQKVKMFGLLYNRNSSPFTNFSWSIKWDNLTDKNPAWLRTGNKKVVWNIHLGRDSTKWVISPIWLKYMKAKVTLR